MRVEAGDGGAVTLNSPVAKFLSHRGAGRIAERLGAEAGDLLFLVADEWAPVWPRPRACSASSWAGPR